MLLIVSPRRIQFSLKSKMQFFKLSLLESFVQRFVVLKSFMMVVFEQLMLTGVRAKTPVRMPKIR